MIYLALTVILISAASAQKCPPPPYRHDMTVIYGMGFVEFGCPNLGGSYLLRCVDGQWQGYVPESCDQFQPSPRPQPVTAAPPQPRSYLSTCGPPPQREDMLSYEGPGGRFVDYYCKPPPRGYYRSFAYRLVCRSGSWKGELPPDCPRGLENYPKPQ